MTAPCGASGIHNPHQYSITGVTPGMVPCPGILPRTEWKIGPIRPVESDSINHPSHYTWGPVEVIDLTEHLNFCLGNVVKYVCRADHKGSPIEDLKKAKWYLEREIQRREKESE